MITLLDRLGPSPTRARFRRRHAVFAALAAVLAVGLVAAVVLTHRVRASDLHQSYLGTNGWPTSGQAAYRLGAAVHVGPGQTPVPIASVAKVMTAYVVLAAMPLHGAAEGPTITVTTADVRDYARRRHRDESVVRVVKGERLTERQALAALLIPSANNVADLLARRVAGSDSEFVARMNATARRLGMTQTRYADPSGFDPRTISTAQDQLILASAVANNNVINDLTSRTSFPLPVVAAVHNTNALLGRDGFVGIKTGSDDAAGGCFMFHSYRVVNKQITDVVGVVLGQRGHHDITAGLTAARQLVDRLGPAAGA